MDSFETEDSTILRNAAGVIVVADTPGINSGSVSVTGDADGIVYWYFGCEGASYTYDSLKSEIEFEYGNFTEMNTGKSPYDFYIKYIYGNTTVPTGNIIDFFWQRLHNDCTNHVMSADRVYKDESLEL